MKIEYDKLISLSSYFKLNFRIYIKSETLTNLFNIDILHIPFFINKLQSFGYNIEFHNKRGYRLNKTTEQLLPWEIKYDLKTKIIGTKIYYFDKLFSTQDFALKILHKQENGAVIISRKQLAGRGRCGKPWISDKGSLCFSIILYPDMDIKSMNFFPVIAALALSITIHKNIKLKPTIKYPNDILIDDKKIAGILIDSATESNIINYVVIGIGINFNINVNSINNKLNELGCNYSAGTLFRSKTNFTQIQFLQMLLSEFERFFNILQNNNLSYIIRTWNKYSKTKLNQL